jgi:hypothetical protein
MRTAYCLFKSTFSSFTLTTSNRFSTFLSLSRPLSNIKFSHSFAGETYRDFKKRELIQGYTQFPPVFLDGGKRVSVYVGIDPTAGSLHIGHLPLMLAMCRLHRAGKKRPTD